MDWFSSDWHLGHKNIVKAVSKYSSGNLRDFASLEEHDRTIIDNVNRHVKENDTLYFLGDFSFGGLGNLPNHRRAIRCNNVHFLIGNHDKDVEKNKIINPSTMLRMRHLFSSVQHYLKLRIGGQKVIMSHYPMRAWDSCQYGSIMLHGHTHGSLDTYSRKDYGLVTGDMRHLEYVAYKTMDVGIDAHPDFRPFSWEEVTEIMKTRVNLDA